jgi:hypothetical protein
MARRRWREAQNLIGSRPSASQQQQHTWPSILSNKISIKKRFHHRHQPPPPPNFFFLTSTSSSLLFAAYTISSSQEITNKRRCLRMKEGPDSPFFLL